MRRKFEVVGTIDQSTQVFGTTHGLFSMLVAVAFEKQFNDLKARFAPGDLRAVAPGETLSTPECDLLAC